ncbi:SH3 domain-containing protein [Mesobacillus foraminis]|uniref:Beta-N-acetylglucosaminidase n=1 Tax=Mesobacillus foraminis TaxID=279826 RepID=A0A4R2BJC3_9BACI|nr:SH3 domain-containing protein [Mesobacillus foraminis]TCN26705.1 beta-N-acetylglucosaminidase [Mesobacillus foraminis]
MKAIKQIRYAVLIIILLTGVLAPYGAGGFLTAQAASTSISKTIFTTSQNLNMRTGPSTKYKTIITVPKGKNITAIARNGNWYKSSYTYKSKGKNITKTGWLSGQYLKKVSSAPSNTVHFAKTIYQVKDNLRLRTGSSAKDKAILTIPKGRTLTSTSKKGNWYKASYTYSKSGRKYTATGWVDGRYLKEYTQYSKTAGTYYFTKKTAGLYSAPDTKKKAAYTLGSHNGFYSTQKAINSLGQTWYQVSYKGKSLYVKAADVVKHTPKSIKKTNYKAAKNTYLYQSYGEGYTKLIMIPKGKIISVSSSIENWYKTSYGGKTGYVYISNFTKSSSPAEKKPFVFTETASAGKKYLTKEDARIRRTPESTSATLAFIPKSKLIVPTHKTSNGWYKIKYSGKTGYVSAGAIQEVITGSPANRDNYQYIDLRTKAPVTAAQINAYISSYVKQTGKSSILTGSGQTFIQAGNKYGVNALYLAAHAIHESGYGTSLISLGKYNLFGFGAYDATPYIGAYRFASVQQSIEYIAREMKATYLNPGSWKYKGSYLGFSTKTTTGTRIDSYSTGMNFYYASDPNWGKGIAAHMQRILPYSKAYYSNAKPNTTVFSAPARPDGKDVFPAGIQATASQTLALTLKKGGTVAKTLPKGDAFTLLEKGNDFWLRVKVGSKTYYAGVKRGNDVSIISFDRYKEFLTVKNLGRVTTSGLNVRTLPLLTASKAGGPLRLNQYIQLKLDKLGKPKMDKSKKWYLIKLSNGKEGWVSSQFVARELK